MVIYLSLILFWIIKIIFYFIVNYCSENVDILTFNIELILYNVHIFKYFQNCYILLNTASIYGNIKEKIMWLDVKMTQLLFKKHRI